MPYAFVNILYEMKISVYYMYCRRLRYCLFHSYQFLSQYHLQATISS